MIWLDKENWIEGDGYCSYWDDIAGYGVLGDNKEHVINSLTAGYSTVFKGVCSGGHLELKHKCSSAIYHRYYCINPLVPYDGADWPRGTGYTFSEDGEPQGHVNDFYLDPAYSSEPGLSFHPKKKSGGKHELV